MDAGSLKLVCKYGWVRAHSSHCVLMWRKLTGSYVFYLYFYISNLFYEVLTKFLLTFSWQRAWVTNYPGLPENGSFL